MRNFWLVLSGSFALVLSGCGSTTSAYVTAGEGFTEAMDSAKASVKLLADQRTRVGRVAYANNLIVRKQVAGGSIEKEFGEFVCKGTGALAEARDRLGAVLAQLQAFGAVELLASDMRGALDALGEISGRVDNERMLDRLFSTFCIGK